MVANEVDLQSRLIRWCPVKQKKDVVMADVDIGLPHQVLAYRRNINVYPFIVGTSFPDRCTISLSTND